MRWRSSSATHSLCHGVLPKSMGSSDHWLSPLKLWAKQAPPLLCFYVSILVAVMKSLTNTEGKGRQEWLLLFPKCLICCICICVVSFNTDNNHSYHSPLEN
jgi:hypothetical protein